MTPKSVSLVLTPYWISRTKFQRAFWIIIPPYPISISASTYPNSSSIIFIPNMLFFLCPYASECSPPWTHWKREIVLVCIDICIIFGLWWPRKCALQIPWYREHSGSTSPSCHFSGSTTNIVPRPHNLWEAPSQWLSMTGAGQDSSYCQLWVRDSTWAWTN